MKTLLLVLSCALLASLNGIAQSGTNDDSFNPGDFGHGYGDGPNGPILSMALQPDGKIIVAGDFTSYNGIVRNRVARLNLDGSLDMSFDSGNGANARVNAIALRTDGSIIIGGAFSNYNGMDRNRLACLNVDGSLDMTFNPGTALPIWSGSEVYVILTRSSGDFFVGGRLRQNQWDENLFLLNADGSLAYPVPHPSLNSSIHSLCEDAGLWIGTGSGTVVHAELSQSSAYCDISVSVGAATIESIVMLSDGNLMIGGGGYAYGVYPVSTLAIINNVGEIITSPIGGLIQSGVIKTILNLPGNKVIIAGDFTATDGGITRKRIARLNYDGSLDPTFNPALTFPTGGLMVRQTDGKVVLPGGPSGGLTRLNADGSLDVSFPPAGTGANGDVNAICVQPNGKIIIGGSFQAYNGVATRLARLNPDGGLDTDFDTDLPLNGSISGIAVQANGKVLIAGLFPQRITRFNSDGTPDNSFSPPILDSTVHVVTAQQDGRIMIGGQFTSVNDGAYSRNRVARLNADGSLHLSFDPGNGADGAVRTIVPMAAGKTLIGGAFNSYGGFSMAHVAQLNADGTLDTGFNIGSGITDDTVRVIVRQDNGKVLVAGDFYVFNGVYSPNIVRLNPDGSMDTTFSSGYGVDGHILCMALQADGKILIGGEFSTYDGTVRNRIARLNTNGSLDPGFNPVAGASATINTLALQPDGKAVIGGAFTSYNGTGRNRVARVINDIGSGVQENEVPAVFAHPNPTRGMLTLELPMQPLFSGLRVLDTTGRLVLSQLIGKPNNSITVDLSGQESGLYLVQVLFVDGTRTEQRVVKE